ncbi:MAG: DUF4062 domain-containing protein [Pseudonocardiaceae bacterium]
MISSTTKDMLAHRQQALNACLRQGFFPVMMEHLPPSPDDAVSPTFLTGGSPFPAHRRLIGHSSAAAIAQCVNAAS